MWRIPARRPEARGRTWAGLIVAILAGVAAGPVCAQQSKELSWNLPTERTDGTALSVDELAFTRVLCDPGIDELVPVPVESWTIYPPTVSCVLRAIDINGLESADSARGFPIWDDPEPDPPGQPVDFDVSVVVLPPSTGPPGAGVMPAFRDRYVNTGSTAGGDGTTTATTGANRAYASLNAALTNEAGNIVTSDEVVRIFCAGGQDSSWVENDLNSASWVMDATRYVQIHPQTGHEAETEWDAGKYRWALVGDFEINAQVAFRKITFGNIQIDYASRRTLSTGSSAGTAHEYTFDRTHLRKTSGTTYWFGHVFNGRNADIRFRNAILHSTATGHDGGLIFGRSILENVTIIANVSDVILRGEQLDGLLLKNVIVQNAGTGAAVSGTIDANSVTVLTNDATSPTVALRSISLDFVSATDFALAATDTAAMDVGTSLIADFSVDIVGTTRPQGSAWDVGAFEFPASGTDVSAGLSTEPPVLAASVTREVTASGALSVPVATLAAAAEAERQAAADLSIAALQLSADAGVIREASAALGITPLQLAASGSVERNASVALTLTSPTLSATAGAGRNVSATLEITAPELLSDVMIERSVSAALATPAATLAADLGAAKQASGALVTPVAELSADLGAERSVSAVLETPSPVLTSQVSVVRLASGELALAVPVLASTVLGEALTVSGALQTPVPVLDAAAMISRTASGALQLTLPVLDGDISREVNVEAVLIVRAPELAAQAAIAQFASGELTLAELEMAAQVFQGAIQPVIGLRATVRQIGRTGTVAQIGRTATIRNRH